MLCSLNSDPKRRDGCLLRLDAAFFVRSLIIIRIITEASSSLFTWDSKCLLHYDHTPAKTGRGIVKGAELVAEVVLVDHNVMLHVIAVVRTFVTVILVTTFVVAPHSATEEHVANNCGWVGKHAAMFLAVTAITILIAIIHGDIALGGSLFSRKLLFLFFFLLPHLGDAARELIVHRNFYISLLLDQDDAIVEVTFL